ncbi:ABC transporter ATP-binding protein [Actinoplanes friuliensis]|jgi:putative spermidine/putrescine transport system ATP-binding protein|uniref:ABC-type quaternary amine transporter n=1 Tax=Actinoplanes friuliensis DSM 7358 TaxID=1246995 RepID=U5VWN4_9ACTN|nr:ABC transporter ATP-binding protein [Actinoplanes friuliensis]AGZ41418.1 spermidine/putrescine ABC transporter ATPase [Actinoplanes friuliensis DSM 7358]
MNSPAIGATGARVELVDLCKRYGTAEPPAVDSIALDIQPGEFITLLGPSGSGKTTTLNMIVGFTEPTSGRIELNGKDISRTPAHKRNFGMVFQNYALFPHLTVAQNVAFPLRERKVPAAQSAKLVGDALELVDLGGMGNRRPHELSGGQQQRVALARAVVFSPSVLLLDEPLSALDRKLRQSLQREIKRLHDELGLTFVFVTHDQDEAMTLSDRIAIFDHGKIVAVGTPAELYHRPTTQFVARFLGESNVFAGRYRSADVYEWNDRKWTVRETGDGTENQALIVRPERLQVAFDEESVPSGSNVAPAAVTDVSFYGTYYRIELAFDDNSTGMAVLPVGAPAVVDPGTRVIAHWRPEDQVLVSQ